MYKIRWSSCVKWACNPCPETTTVGQLSTCTMDVLFRVITFLQTTCFRKWNRKLFLAGVIFLVSVYCVLYLWGLCCLVTTYMYMGFLCVLCTCVCTCICLSTVAWEHGMQKRLGCQLWADRSNCKYIYMDSGRAASWHMAMNEVNLGRMHV